MYEEGTKKEETKETKTTAGNGSTRESKAITAVGTAGAAAGALLAAAWVGVFPAALAGTAAYLAYRGLKHRPVVVSGRH